MSDSPVESLVEGAVGPVDAAGPDASAVSPVPVALPDDRNPPILDARKTFILTMIGAALFIGSVFAFVL